MKPTTSLFTACFAALSLAVPVAHAIPVTLSHGTSNATCIGDNTNRGDIFIDLNGDAPHTVLPKGSGGGGVSNDLGGYDLVIDLNFGAMTFSLIQLTTDSLIDHGLEPTDPWTYLGGGVVVEGFENAPFCTLTSLVNTNVASLLYCTLDDLGNPLNLDLLPESLRNLTLPSQGASVPDGGATVGLLGLALLGILGARRRFGRR